MGLDLDQYGQLINNGDGTYTFVSADPDTLDVSFAVPATDGSGNTVISNSLILEGGFVLPDAISVTVNTNSDDLNIPNLTSGVTIRVDTTGNRDLTGIVPPDTGQSSILFITNVGTGTLRLKNNDAGSQANNRFIMGTNENLSTDQSAIFVYDTTGLHWRMYAIHN